MFIDGVNIGYYFIKQNILRNFPLFLDFIQRNASHNFFSGTKIFGILRLE
jgi:hypothetical protein